MIERAQTAEAELRTLTGADALALADRMRDTQLSALMERQNKAMWPTQDQGQGVNAGVGDQSCRQDRETRFNKCRRHAH